MTEQNKTTTIPLPVPGKDMDSIMQSLESGVEELFTSNRYQEFLKTMAKFHNYSFNNTMLIAMQRPDATLVTSYKNWQSMGRQVMKGEKGITIIAPAPYKKASVMFKRIRNYPPSSLMNFYMFPYSSDYIITLNRGANHFHNHRLVVCSIKG